MNDLKALENDFFKCSTEADANALLEHCDQAFAMVSIHDQQGIYMKVSSSSTEFIGIRPADLVGNSAYDYFHPDDFQNILKTHARVTIRPEVEKVDYRLRMADGCYFPVSTFSRQLTADDRSDFILALTFQRR